MTDGDLDLICSDIEAGGVVSLALIFAMNRQIGDGASEPSAVGRPWYRARQGRTEKALTATNASRVSEAGAWSCPETETLRPTTNATSTGACRPEPTSTSTVTRAESRGQHDRRRLY